MYGRLNLNHTCMLIMNFKVHSLTTEANHLEACNFPYTFETMLRIIPDQ